MAQEGVNLGFTHITRMFFRAEVFDVTNDPIAVGLLGAVRVMMITKYLTDLVHKLYAGIGSEFSFVFHDINNISSYDGKFNHYFPIFPKWILIYMENNP